jgi:hypothetical protein
VGVYDLWKHLHLIEISCRMSIKVSWNIVVKIIEILILKGFGIVYVCVKFMVGEWCGILVVNRK